MPRFKQGKVQAYIGKVSTVLADGQEQRAAGGIVQAGDFFAKRSVVKA